MIAAKLYSRSLCGEPAVATSSVDFAQTFEIVFIRQFLCPMSRDDLHEYRYRLSHRPSFTHPSALRRR